MVSAFNNTLVEASRKGDLLTLLPHCNAHSAKRYIHGGLGHEPHLAEWIDAQVQRLALRAEIDPNPSSSRPKRAL